MGLLDQRLQELRKIIPEVQPLEAARAMQTGARLIDVREPSETANASPLGALRVPRGFVEMRLPEQVAALDTALYVMCASGVRSLMAAEALKALGYTNVASVQGGFGAWCQAGLTTEVPVQLSVADQARYARHLSIPEVGEAGQIKLLSSKILLVGAGGLGSPAALYLAAAGVGTLGLVDDDVVDTSNLQRQILHTQDRVGVKKVASAQKALLALNPHIQVNTHELRLSAENVEDVFSGYDLVLDGCDNFATRYLINDACVKLGLPNVHAAVFRFEGDITVYSPKVHGGPCYRCNHPNAPPPEFAPNCAQAGVLGVLPGVMGMLQAVEALKIVLDVGKPLVGRVLNFDALKAEFFEFEAEKNSNCKVCGVAPEAIAYQAIEQACSLT